MPALPTMQGREMSPPADARFPCWWLAGPLWHSLACRSVQAFTDHEVEMALTLPPALSLTLPCPCFRLLPVLDVSPAVYLGLGPADHPPGPYLKLEVHLHPQFPWHWAVEVGAPLSLDGEGKRNPPSEFSEWPLQFDPQVSLPHPQTLVSSSTPGPKPWQHPDPQPHLHPPFSRRRRVMLNLS